MHEQQQDVHLLKKVASCCKSNKVPFAAVIRGLFHSLAPDFVEQLDPG
jgi:hypothetical protein